MTATMMPPRVTWISDLERETSRKRLRTQANLAGAHCSAKRAGFVPDRAEVVVSGLCSDCRAG